MPHFYVCVEFKDRNAQHYTTQASNAHLAWIRVKGIVGFSPEEVFKVSITQVQVV